jgi:formate hydrogenlyase subunit 3/multisubunit Na+/H+ antiporter MnhD subunit
MHFELDATGRVFLLFSAILWALAGYQARHQLADDPHARLFTGFFLATLAGNLLLILAADLAGFYLGYALMTFAAYGLIVHKGSAEALRAGRVYLLMALLGEVLLLVLLMLGACRT